MIKLIRKHLLSILIVNNLFLIPSAFALDNPNDAPLAVPSTPAQRIPNPNQTEATAAAPLPAYNISGRIGICEAMEKFYGWSDGKEIDFTKFKQALANLPPTLTVTPQDSINTILNLQADSATFFCKEDPNVKTKGTVMISYVTNGEGYNSPTINIISNEPDYEKQKPPEQKIPAMFPPITPEQKQLLNNQLNQQQQLQQ